MGYPPVPTHVLSKSRLATLQKIQNRAPRQAYKDTSYPPRFTTQELHRKVKLKPINQIQEMRHNTTGLNRKRDTNKRISLLLHVKDKTRSTTSKILRLL